MRIILPHIFLSLVCSGLIIAEYLSSKEYGLNGMTPYIMIATAIAVFQIFLTAVTWNKTKIRLSKNIFNLFAGIYSLIISVAAYFWYISWV